MLLNMFQELIDGWYGIPWTIEHWTVLLLILHVIVLVWYGIPILDLLFRGQ